MTLLNHHGQPIKDDANYNMILLNNIMHSESPLRRMSSRGGRAPRMMGMDVPEPSEYTDTNSLLCELVAHVKQINEELHMRHYDKEHDEQYKSEWQLVALVLDRCLLVIFFIMTSFICVIIFVNVPGDHDHKE